MLVSYRWLESYTDVPWDPEELAERLTMSGTKVEAIHYPGKGLENVVVGVIQSVGPHPSADGLHVCEVSVGDRTLTTVTGAPVVRQDGRFRSLCPARSCPDSTEPSRSSRCRVCAPKACFVRKKSWASGMMRIGTARPARRSGSWPICCRAARAGRCRNRI